MMNDEFQNRSGGGVVWRASGGQRASRPQVGNLRNGRLGSLRYDGGGLLGVVVTLLVFTCLRCAGMEWQEGQGFRRAPIVLPAEGKTGFTRLSSTITGLAFTNYLSDERSITNRNLLSGSGVAAGDVDGDGRCDLYFCSLGLGNVLYRNLGNWKFQDVTEAAGVACRGQDSTGAVMADVDGDGDLDLLVNSLGGGTRLFENDGRGHFRDITAASGLASSTGSTSMALADIDGDGDLDLYVTNFRPRTIKDEPSTRFRIRVDDGQPIVAAVNDRPATAPDLTNRFVVSPAGTVLEQGEADALYLNDGRGKFRPVSFTGGAFLDEDGLPLREAPHDWGLAVQFHDLNGDGAPDLYICNDLHTPDRIWINHGRGTFRAIGRTAIRCTSVFSMGVDMADVNHDGNVDIFVVDMFSREHQKRHVQVAASTPVRWPVGLYEYRPQINRNTLQISRGDGTFAETAWFSGVQASEWSWGPIFLDVDLDGYEDILVMNGQLRDFQNADLDRQLGAMKNNQRMSMLETLRLVKLYPRLASPKLIFRNRGDLTFEEVGAAWGFASTGIAQGMLLADLDNDGDLDVVTNNLNEEAGVYQNGSVAARVSVRLMGRAPNTRGIGAKVALRGGIVPLQSQEMIAGGRYLSGDENVRTFAAGMTTNSLTLEVTWRSGNPSIITNATPNSIYEIEEPLAGIASASREPPAAAAASRERHFEDVSHLLKHTHAEEPFDDFERQPLLPNRLSQLGPGVAWQDYDGDGWDDLVIGSGRSGHLSVYRNNGHGGFDLRTDGVVTNLVARDQTSVLVPALNTVLAGSSNYEDGSTNGGLIRVYDLARNVSAETVRGQAFSAGPLAMADIDHDGDLDLFVGGRVTAGRYPEPAPSLLMRNDNGRLVPWQRWDALGLVSGATFSDLDNDGTPELLLACEWSPLRVFKLTNDSFQEVTDDLGLKSYRGWWRGVATGDLDGDGRLDIVASNWGLNSVYQTSRKHPRRLYYSDFDGNGIVDIVDAYFDPDMNRYVPQRNFRAASAALPFIQENISTFQAYAEAGVEQIYGDRLRTARMLEIDTLESMVFFNRGERFEARPLPQEAQMAPAFGVTIADLDGDGIEDVLLSQNFAAVNPDAHPSNAGRALWLKGDGTGGLTPVRGQDGGIEVYGEQRGCAVADYDGDGRLDLIITQNGSESKLYRNRGARPGLRVRLRGPDGNPAAFGAASRLENGAVKGTVHELRAGSGYLSQDSPVTVLGFNGQASAVWVRWPGGKETQTAIPPGAREVTIGMDGKVQQTR